ncbi:MAG: hypothetical protein M1814_005691 [Vezdaea aestivalis]|nr:MAG: hypothetical protein M1814_005691 [Vezdaea aestivalis]
MDSMRSLNTSLPHSSLAGRSRRRHPSPELLAGFKSAALSLTNFYKKALADQSKVREAGYQDALDDLLHFLDQANIGLDDGEGWDVRQWATSRLKITTSPDISQAESEDDTRPENENRARSSSPVLQTKRGASPIDRQPTPPPRLDSAPPTAMTGVKIPAQPILIKPNSNVFTFRSDVQYPQVVEGEPASTDGAQSMPTKAHTEPAVTRSPSRRELRLSKIASKQTQHVSVKPNTRPAGIGLGAGVGTKRRNPFDEIFGIDLGIVKDGSGSKSKRARQH